MLHYRRYFGSECTWWGPHPPGHPLWVIIVHVIKSGCVGEVCGSLWVVRDPIFDSNDKVMTIYVSVVPLVKWLKLEEVVWIGDGCYGDLLLLPEARRLSMGEVITYPDTKIVSCEIMVEHAAYHIKVAVGDLALWGFTWSEGRHNVIWEMRLTYYGVRSCRIGCLLRSASMRLQYLWDCYGSRENVTPTHVTRGIVIFIQGGVDRHQILKLRLVPLRIFC